MSYRDRYYDDRVLGDKFKKDYYKKEDHNHEVQGSTFIADYRRNHPHNHRFCTVSGCAIPTGRGDHIHEVKFHTDTYDGHKHEFCGKTGGAIRVGDRHVHCIESITSISDGHRHKFRVATLIDNPIEPDYYEDDRVRSISYKEYKDYCKNKDCNPYKDDYRRRYY